MSTAIIIGCFLILIYAFQGIFAFIPYFMGILFKFLFYPIEIISQVIYPVSSMVYIFYSAFLTYMIVSWILSLFKLGK